MEPQVPSDLPRATESWSELHPWERRQLGVALRRCGLTYSEIMSLVPVAKSTLAGWCRDVRLSTKQIAAIARRTAQGMRPEVPRDTQWKRRREIDRIRSAAETFAKLHIDDAFFVAGVVLYWGEGAKTRNNVEMTNTDPATLRLFVAWIRRYIDPDADFSLRLHLHAGNDEPLAMSFWREQVGLPTAPFGKTFVKQDGTGHRKNQHRHGVCCVRMRRAADAWNRIMVWIDVVASSYGDK